MPKTQESPAGPRRVALLLHTSSDWTRGIIRGVADAALDMGGWDFFIEPRGYDEQISLPRDWTGDGIIVRLTHGALERALRQRGLPCVNVSWMGQHSRAVPKVVSDEAACGRLAAEHFLQLAFRSFAYVGSIHRSGYAETTQEAYVAAIRAAGFSVNNFAAAQPPDVVDLAAHRPALKKWLRSLPRPTAVFAWNSEIGRELVTCATQVGRRIPDDLAILVNEFDQLLTSLAPVPLSNVDQAAGRVGQAAAQLLERMMQGEPAPESPILVPPVGIVQRRSTQTTAVEDPFLANILRWMQDNAHRPIQIIDIEEQFQVSRRMLEHRFKQHLESTPAHILRRMRLQSVKRYLGDTTLPLARIATLTGFNHVEVLVRTFRRELGITPGEFRKQR
jgi:LacI family transcriptional regulator